MKQDELQVMIDRAKTKNDGIYSHLGIKYVVKNNRLRFLYQCDTIYQFESGFLITIGKSKYDSNKKLKELLAKGV